MIPYGKQEINQDDINAVVEVLQSDYLTQGSKVPEFEQKISEYCEATNAVATNSATSALHIACLALGVKKGDVVWTSPISFVASANCALHCGASVDFVDIDPVTYNLCAKNLKEKLAATKLNKQLLPKVVIPVHMTGQSCDMTEIYRLSKEYDFSIIEDAAHAIGGHYRGRAVGSCEYSDITVFSFHPVKVLTTAEGGAATTNNDELAEKMRLYRSHGVTRDVDKLINQLEGLWDYHQIVLGYNFRMTDLQAALGISQIGRLKQFIKQRNAIADYYDQSLKNLPLTLPFQHSYADSARHLYVIRLNLSAIKLTRKEVYDELRLKGIGVNVHFIPIHTQPFYQQLGFKVGDFPEAEKYYSEAISIPLFTQLTEDNLEYIVNALRSTLS